MRLALTTLAMLSIACGPAASQPDAGLDAARAEDAGALPAVGRECLPEAVPPGGFDSREIYLETSSAQCGVAGGTGTCIVYQLDGDPRTVDCAGCPTADEVRDRVFCTCRCSSDVAGASLCACPDGFACVDDVLTTGGDGLRGGYCIRDGL